MIEHNQYTAAQFEGLNKKQAESLAEFVTSLSRKVN